MAAAKSAAVIAPKHASQPTPERKRFSLSGPSRPLDLTHNAARRDLADVRLAGRWFAPHYAVAESWTCTNGCTLHAAREGEALGDIAAGESFAVLEIAGDWAWGFQESDGRVGYVPVAALDRAP
ncbi:SH3 domain-containing protein [Sphingomonas sp.]|jgi:hypothetical protein|uniref:SH3 domain-containing protein n=1 Tax=Sphingomonas sp. TaxID=28214 RepID=UPI002DE645B3|nr:SH3 domain-containing protein [Sphingomonas sp.]